jgi:hypothetical protein
MQTPNNARKHADIPPTPCFFFSNLNPTQEETHSKKRREKSQKKQLKGVFF